MSRNQTPAWRFKVTRPSICALTTLNIAKRQLEESHERKVIEKTTGLIFEKNKKEKIWF